MGKRRGPHAHGEAFADTDGRVGMHREGWKGEVGRALWSWVYSLRGLAVLKKHGKIEFSEPHSPVA